MMSNSSIKGSTWGMIDFSNTVANEVGDSFGNSSGKGGGVSSGDFGTQLGSCQNGKGVVSSEEGGGNAGDIGENRGEGGGGNDGDFGE